MTDAEQPAPPELPAQLPPRPSRLPPAWRERLDDLRARADSPGRLAAAVVLVVGLAVAGVAVLRSGSPAPPPELSLPMASASSSGGSAPGATATTVGAVVVVHAAGAVGRPGLYRLATGSRVDDVISAAGGLAPDADADRINLAAPVTDGERVYVPKVGEAVPADAAGPSSSSPSGPIDLNTATESQLDALPGVGPATAKAIVDERARRGGRFRSVDDLLDVRGIGPAKLEEIRPLVTVR